MASDRLANIASAIERIENDESEDQLCATFTLADEEVPWVQSVPGALNIWWPFDEDPADRLKDSPLAALPGCRAIDWEAGVFATFEFEPFDAPDQAAVIDELFQRLYDCPASYQLLIEVYAVEDEVIPDRVPIARVENYHTDKVGRHRDGLFMGFVAATLPPPDELPSDDSGADKRWYAVLHRFDAGGGYLETQHWCAGSTADGESQVVNAAQQRLAEMISKLHDVEFSDIEVELFSTEIDGHTFGLVDGTVEDEETGEVHVRAELLPNDLVFYPPWDGNYST